MPYHHHHTSLISLKKNPYPEHFHSFSFVPFVSRVHLKRFIGFLVVQHTVWLTAFPFFMNSYARVSLLLHLLFLGHHSLDISSSKNIVRPNSFKLMLTFSKLVFSGCIIMSTSLPIYLLMCLLINSSIYLCHISLSTHMITFLSNLFTYLFMCIYLFLPWY